MFEAFYLAYIIFGFFINIFILFTSDHDDRTSSDNYNKDFTVEREFYSGRRDQYQDFNDNRQYSSGKRDHYQKVHPYYL